MAVDRLRRVASTAALRANTINSNVLSFDNTSGSWSYKDASGNVKYIAGSTVPSPTNAPTNYSADGAIAIQDGLVTISKGVSAAAMTLAAPTAAQDGLRMTITSRSAFAHVITATDLIEDGVTGGAKDTATFGAFVGATLVLIAVNLKWHVESKNVVTIAGA